MSLVAQQPSSSLDSHFSEGEFQMLYAIDPQFCPTKQARWLVNMLQLTIMV